MLGYINGLGNHCAHHDVLLSSGGDLIAAAAAAATFCLSVCQPVGGCLLHFILISTWSSIDVKLYLFRWEATALERAKQLYLSSVRSVGKSLERASTDRILEAMLGSDRRFRDPTAEETEALTLEGVKKEVEKQLHPANIEVGRGWEGTH